MKKKFRTILSLACLSVACTVAAACEAKTQLDVYRENGYTISVTYNANGGQFYGRSGVTIMDLFKPADYKKDEEGKVHISLTEPTSPDRNHSGEDQITLVMEGHFFAGWYQGRELLKNEAGNVVDTYGVELTEKAAGTYIYADTEEDAIPAYTYSDYWDFKEDTIDYAETDGIVDITLYAAWVPLYEFNYYYKPTEDSEWTLLQSTTYDYKSAKLVEGSTAWDRDTIWVPDWKKGTMNHEYRYADGNEIYTFPKIEGKTFVGAYTDPECQNKIEGSLQHHGTLDIETGIAANRVQNIYIEFKEGMYYRIEKAQDLCDNADPEGIYEIAADLDFYDATTNTQLKWPSAFEGGTFNGKLASTEGQTFKIKNAFAEHASGSTETGGLFGSIANGATVENIIFENATLDLAYIKEKMVEGTFGLFAGYIADGANVSNVSVSGKIKVGTISWRSDSVWNINLLTNGQKTGVTQGEITLTVYGERDWTTDDKYIYTVYPTRDKITVDADGDLQLCYVDDMTERFDQEFYDINLE